VIDKIACEEKLRQGLMTMNIQLTDKNIIQLIQYLEEFYKWNKAYNLSSIREPLAMVERHLLDSLALVPLLKKAVEESQQQEKKLNRIIDVGTGGGLPGIPLAIIFPEITFFLLDSNGKKTRFLFQVKTSLELTNIAIENTRAENYQVEEKFNIVISRAFASLKDMVVTTAHLLGEQGRFWAMKGIYPENELRDCEKHAIVDAFTSLDIPCLEGERHLLILNPVLKPIKQGLINSPDVS
jgi:16S rRNA (guanine527-N7)-methyltransferase